MLNPPAWARLEFRRGSRALAPAASGGVQQDRHFGDKRIGSSSEAAEAPSRYRWRPAWTSPK